MTTTALPFATIAARFRDSEQATLNRARADFTAAAATNAAYAVKWHLDTVIRAETRLVLWTVAADRGPGALTSKLAEYLNPTDSRSSDPFARASAEAQREAALQVLGGVAERIDTAALIERLT